MRQMFCSFLIVFMVFFSGCGGISSHFNTATGEQETTMYSTDREQEIGASVAREIEKEYTVIDEVALNARVDRIMEKIASVCDRKDITYIAKVIEEKKLEKEPIVNAVSLPGGYVYVFKGLMEYIKSDEELAAVIAHEVAHVTARHSIKRLQASYGSMIAIIGAITVDGRLAGGINAATTTMLFSYSQDDEIQADTLGIKYMRAAGYDPQGMVRMLEQLGAYNRKQPIRARNFWRTHPFIHERIAAVNRAISGDLTFRDYVRMTGERDGYKK